MADEMESEDGLYDVVVLTNEEGVDTEYVILADLEYEGATYIAVTDYDAWRREDVEGAEVIPYLYTETVDEGLVLEAIEDEDAYEAVTTAFGAMLSAYDDEDYA